MSNGNAAWEPEQVVAMFEPIADSLAEAAHRAGISPADMQSTIWNQAVHNA